MQPDTHEQILEYLAAQDEPVTSADIANGIKAYVKRVRLAMVVLVSQGDVLRIGKGLYALQTGLRLDSPSHSSCRRVCGGA